MAHNHFVKSKSKTRLRQPARNHAHAVPGLLIALAFWQVFTGYKHKYPEWTMGAVPMGVRMMWIVWVVLMPMFYLTGLAVLLRQFKQELAGK